MRVLVLGGYGFIGLEIVRHLSASGVDVVGLARSAKTGQRLAPSIKWIGADLARLTTAEAWKPFVADVDAVVNASGALQNGARDDLAAVQDRSIRALIEAGAQANVRRFVQISAPGAGPDAPVAFLQTKGRADAALKTSALDWIIFRPGLVVGANAYGGTRLLRTLAAFPIVQPLVLGSARIQTVAMSDVVEAVRKALAGEAPMRAEFDLVEESPHELRDVVAQFRVRLGWSAARRWIDLPDWFGFAMARFADLAGWAGWRSPLQTTALRILSRDVLGDPKPWRDFLGRPLKSLDEILESLPPTAQERSFARAQLVFPLLVLSLASFWIASGLIAFWRRDEAAAILRSPFGAAADGLVLAGAITDIAIGLGLLVRPWTRLLALAAIGVSVIYMIAGSIAAPHLWLDPLGPFVKIIPGAALALAVAALAQER
jgi:uncharacterized protein YbjT (DUF2867 family)